LFGCLITIIDEMQRLKAIFDSQERRKFVFLKYAEVLFYCDSKKLYCKLKCIDYFHLKKNNTSIIPKYICIFWKKKMTYMHSTNANITSVVDWFLFFFTVRAGFGSHRSSSLHPDPPTSTLFKPNFQTRKPMTQSNPPIFWFILSVFSG
jgi:hypothetical protein